MALTQVPASMMAAGGVPSFDGIKFPASQVTSADANTLDDYEEGTFTPTFANLTVGNGSVWGHYTKIGNKVHIECGVLFGTTTAWTGTCTGASGLPFTSKTIAGAQQPLPGVVFKSGSGWYGAYATIGSGSSGLSYPITSAVDAGVNSTQPFSWASNDSMSFCGSYLV